MARTCGQCRGTGKVIAKPCDTCRGDGHVVRERKLTVKIPAGIATGQRLRLYGEGEHGSAGGPPGDLYVVVQVQEHEFFRRDGNDLYLRDPGELHDVVARGTGRVIPSRSTSEESIDIPAGTQTGATFRLRGKGMPDVSGRGRGDLIVLVHGTVPKKLTKEQRAAMEQLGEAAAGGQIRTQEAGRRGPQHLRTSQGYLRVGSEGSRV